MKKLNTAWVLGLLLAASSAHATVNLLDKDDWKVGIGGFVEFDSIHDSVRDLTEIIGNTPIDRPTTIGGQSGREQFSMRNTRLSFDVTAPAYDGWKGRAYFEMDFLGFDSGPPAQSEAAFFNNPTMRVRHAFLSGESEGWVLLAGQTWAFLGWQPYYFMPSVQVAPLPAMLYSRTTQVRATKTFDMSDDNKFQVGLGVMRPPQRDSEYPSLEGGARLVLGSRTAGFVAGATPAEKAQPMSIGVSGTVREFSIPSNIAAPTTDTTHYMGSAFAVDALIPVLASSDNKDVSNTLMIGGEFTMGKGDGDQFSNWSGGTPSPSTNANAPANYKNYNLDAGMGGLDAASNFFLLNVETFNAYAQYHLPAVTKTWISGGYGWLHSDNAANLGTGTGALGAAAPYQKEEVYFGNIFHNLTNELRVAVEYAHIRTTYVDATVAGDNRLQVSAWLIF